MNWKSVSVTVFACAVSVSIGAQTPPPGSQERPKPSSTQSEAAKHATSSGSADLDFVHKAAMGGMAEVELGRLATQKAEHPDVKQFGQRMVDDHGKANDELKQLAASKNITLPAELDAKHKATQNRLNKLNGAAFDRAYMRAMVQDHTQDVAAFDSESKNGKDTQVKDWAGKALPTLRDHLAQAKDINTKLTAGTSGKVKKPGSTPKKSR